ncbi:MAG: hypothetical protein FWD11_00100 [Micrococcales bacterium]|nr:hypothetical protein [Micrococcales bacterium]
MNADLRRFVVVDGDRRLDLVAPGSMGLGEVLDTAGLPRRQGQLRTVAGGVPGSLVRDLDDGALLTVTDLSTSAVPPHGRAVVGRRITGPWWALAAVGLVTISVVLTSEAVEWRQTVAAVLAVVAVVGAVAAVRARDGDYPAFAVVGPALVGVAAVVVTVSAHQVGGTHLVLLAASLAAAAVFTAGAATATQTRASLGVVAVVCMAMAVVWGVLLVLGWDVAMGAAVIAGAVPLGLRALPGALFGVAEGWLIDVERYQDTRWSVRSRPPAVLDVVDDVAVRAKVCAAAQARVVGTVVLSAVGAVALPFAVPPGSASVLVRVGQLGLLVCYVAAMTTLARSVGGRYLHWVPRASAVVAVLVAVRLAGFGGPMLTVVAVVAVLAGLGAAGVAVLVARGTRSLVWSRAADIVEAVAVVVCLPAGLIAADVVAALRRLVA